MFNSGIQELIAAGIIFLLGVIIRSKINWGKTNTDILETLSNDYKTLRILYDSKVEDLKRRDEQLALLKEDLAQTRARITSYENFLQSRSLQTDQVLKQVPHMLAALAKHLNIPLTEEGLDGHDSAHSQVK